MARFVRRLRQIKGHAQFETVFRIHGMLGFRRCFAAEYERLKNPRSRPAFSQTELDEIAKTPRTKPLDDEDEPLQAQPSEITGEVRMKYQKTARIVDQPEVESSPSDAPSRKAQAKHPGQYRLAL